MNIKNNCRKATMIIEKKQSGDISLRQYLFLALHLQRCRECKIYKKQSIQIENLLRDYFFNAAIKFKGLDSNEKKMLQQLINDKLEK